MDWILYGLLGALPWWSYVIVGGISTHLTIQTVTLYLHRSQAHLAVEFHPAVNHWFAFWNWFTTGMKRDDWVAIHRQHHVYADRPGDPHSPVVFPWWRVVILGVFRYIEATRDTAMIEKRKHNNALADSIFPHFVEPRFYGKHPLVGVTLASVIVFTLFGALPGACILLAHVLWIPVLAAGVINGIGHLLFYRNFEVADHSHNIVPWGILIGGEELHNNHHAYPTSAKFSYHWYELDIGWGVIKLLEWLGLARVRHTIPRVGKNWARWGLPLKDPRHLSELRHEVVNHLLALREGSAWDETFTRSLKQFHDRLEAIWKEKSLTSGQLLEALQVWCDDAKQSMVPGLSVLAHELPCWEVRR